MAKFKDADDVDLDEVEGEEEDGLQDAGASLGFNEEDVEFSDDGKVYFSEEQKRWANDENE